MHSLIDGPNSYRVEVSGWNVRGVFFVEKAMLHWTDTGEKSVELISPLRESCMVFVRLIHATSAKANFPIAYRVLSIATEDSEGRGCVHLSQMSPNIDGGENGIGGISPSSKSAQRLKELSN
jgi:hypothetical protein